jgi:hypothetical protein
VEQVGVRVEQSTVRSTPEAAVPPLDDPGFLDYAVAGAEASGEFRCADCGYGAVVHRTLPHCPMCAGTVWESRGRHPARFDD